MSLGIALETKTGIRIITDFDDDGYYWHLWPVFEEIAKKTNKHIDLYGRSEFTSANLMILLAALEKAKGEASLKIDSWEVRTGIVAATQEVLYDDVIRDLLISKLEIIIQAVGEAIRENGSILCTGD